MKKVLGLILVAVLFQSVVFAQETEKKAYKANNLTIFMSDIVMKRFSMEYEHVFGDKGNMAINVNGSASFDEMEDIYGDVQNWWGGIGVKFYPTGQGSIRFFTGPEVRIISAKDEIYKTGYVEITDVMHTAFLLNAGFIYEPTANFIFGVNLGLGIMNRDESSNYNDDYSNGNSVMPMFAPSVRMGVRF